MVSANLIERIHALCGGKAIIETHTELYRDLSLGGDDAYELLENVRKDHEVDFSGFEFKRFSRMKPRQSTISGAGELVCGGIALNPSRSVIWRR